ncbi:hypothetical protein ZWY2020_023483 [Hordeum vulgare]|nr:hypothetical protein ZWY2020_023483 [Hordeum vulgare]
MAADTNAVWSCFVPRELPRFTKKEISPAPASKKALFKRLSCLPAFLPRKLMLAHEAGQGYWRQVLHAFCRDIADHQIPRLRMGLDSSRFRSHCAPHRQKIPTCGDV